MENIQYKKDWSLTSLFLFCAVCFIVSPLLMALVAICVMGYGIYLAAVYAWGSRVKYLGYEANDPHKTKVYEYVCDEKLCPHTKHIGHTTTYKEKLSCSVTGRTLFTLNPSGI